MAEKNNKDSKVKILLFEREPDTIKIVQNALSNITYVIEPVMNAFSGMKTIKEFSPDIVIAHYDFPELNGLGLLKKIQDSGHTIPVILYGVKSEGNILKAFRAGASDYWTKPLFGKEMKDRIDWIHKEILNDAVIKDDKLITESIVREKKELQGLLKITSSLNVSGDTKISLNHLTDLAAEIMNCEAASIMLINERENVLEFVVVSGEKRHRLETINVPMGEGIAGWVAVHGEPQIVNDAKTNKRFTGNVDKETGFETKKILAVPMKLDSDIIGVLEVINTKDNRDFEDNDLRIIYDMSDRVATVIAATRKIEDQQNFFTQTTNIIVKAIEKKDMYAEGHAWKVAEYCHKVGTVLEFSENEKNDLHFGALLHDIGKLILPSYIFNKRELSDRERELIKQHPVQGAKLLEPITLWKGVVPCVLYHHEAWDGSGYPFGRKGDAIPIAGRIINLAEAFSIMRASSSYKKQMTFKESILEIMRSSGKQFDPEIVKVFIGVLEKENIPR